MSYWRIPFIFLAIVNLVAGLWSGLIRIGWMLPLSEVGAHHGAIMVGGFLTSLIALEKAIPLRRKLAFAVPVISALSLMMIVPGLYRLGIFFLMTGSIGFFLMLSFYLHLYPKDISIRLMLVGAACLIIGNAMLFHYKLFPAAFPWWSGFLLFTITAERLELSKFLPVSKGNKKLLYIGLSIFLAGILIPFHGWGRYFSGLAIIAIAVWMLRFDMIRIGLKKSELTRYSSIALLIANSWLIIHAFILMLSADLPYLYDMTVHTFFIGYVFAMIFAHGPIILPGVLGFTAKPYHSILYLWLGIVQGSLAIRVLSDTLLLHDIRRWSGLFTGIGIVLYFITLVIMVRRSRLNAKIH